MENNYPKKLDTTTDKFEAFALLADESIDKNHALQWAFGWFEAQGRKS